MGDGLGVGGCGKNLAMSGISYRPVVDGLRAVAVLSILVYHLNAGWLAGGFVGVDVFFVISGYLITSIIVKESDAGDFSLARFYQRRIARILPAFFAMAAVTLAAVAWIYSPQDLALAGGYLAASALSLTNLKLMFQGSYFALMPDAHPFMHCWSLSLEEQFYLVFPLAVLLVSGRQRRHLFPLLLAAAVLSFGLGLWLTWQRPVWGFYLLPSRAWQLLAGALLAVAGIEGRRWGPKTLTARGAGMVGIVMVAASFVVVRPDGFPGYQALLPTLGTVLLIAGSGPTTGGWVNRFLGSRSMVAVGKMSYSLYLWHWPVFSLVDYRMLDASEGMRVVLKVGLTVILSTACHWFVERPARARLAGDGSRKLAYATAAVGVVAFVSAGLAIQKHNYINAKDGAARPLVINPDGKAGTLMLIGDSHASMYGKMLQDIATERGYRLIVTSCASRDALPGGGGGSEWNDALVVLEREKPDEIILVCAWAAFLDGQGERLAQAVSTLRPLAGRVILITQPPVLPESATRDGIRSGVRPPFFEDPTIRERRKRMNEHVLSAAGGNVEVVDVESLFGDGTGGVPFFDENGRLLYHDSTHLSDYGARRVRERVERILMKAVDARDGE